MPTKTQRLLDLIAFLVRRRFPVAVEDIMAAVPSYAEKWQAGDDTARASVRRMFERDKDELRELGVPIETVPYRIEGQQTDGYRLAGRDFYLPYLRIVEQRRGEQPPEPPPGAQRPGEVWLEPDEAATALDALRRVAEMPAFPFADEARSALGKLAFDLDASAPREEPVLYLDRPGADEIRARLRALTDAIRRRKKASFRYHGIYRGTPTDRVVHAYGLLFQHGHWYLIGHDELRDDVRVFRLGRMADLVVDESAPKAPDYDIPADFDLADYAGRDPWELDGGDEPPLRAEVRFEFPTSLWAARNRHGELVRELPGGAQLRAFDVHQVDPFLRWLLSLAGAGAVTAPDELRRAFAELARATAALYRS